MTPTPDLAARCWREHQCHQTVYDDDRRRKALFLAAHHELNRLTAELARVQHLATQLRHADNSAKYSGVLVVLAGQPLTTVGSFLVEMMSPDVTTSTT